MIFSFVEKCESLTTIIFYNIYPIINFLQDVHLHIGIWLRPDQNFVCRSKEGGCAMTDLSICHSFSLSEPDSTPISI